MPTQKLTSFSQACELAGKDPAAKYSPDEQSEIMLVAACRLLGCRLAPLNWPVNEYTRPLVAHRNLQIIRTAVVGDWKPNWDNWAERKWSPWFYMDKPGFRFDGALFDRRGSDVGSRLCFETDEQAVFVGRSCIALYRDLFGGPALAPAVAA